MGRTMRRVIRAFLLSIAQLLDPAIVRVFLKSLALTLLLCVALGAALWWGSAALAAALGADADWQQLAGAAMVLAALAVGWLVFRAVAILVIDLFGDDVVAAVERRHYPAALATARKVPMARSLAMGLGSAGRTILINLIFAPLYLLLLVTGVGTAVLFFLVNGWLLGRDLMDMVAARHVPQSAMRGWRATTGWPRFMLGLAGTALFVVPIANLLAPIVSAAMATHLFHRRRKA
jgi:uncharacterized protein involved in cysteine biosynthesis